MGHIPAGMEMFPAADIQQLVYIKKVIDECDYYVLIMGARYGSLDQEGVSFTEREYDYAISSGKTVLAFIHKNMDDIARGKTDKDEEKYRKLLAFREKVASGRLVLFWSNPDELAAQAILSLTKAFSTNPQIGWVRADTVPSEATMADVLRYREENDKLKGQLKSLQSAITPKFADAADLSASCVLNYTYMTNNGQRTGKTTITYSEVLRLVAPALHTPATLSAAVQAVRSGLIERYSAPSRSLSLTVANVQDALLHLVATGHVHMWASKTIDNSQNITGYQLTPLGTKAWQEMSYAKSGGA